MSTASPALELIPAFVCEKAVDSFNRFAPDQPLIWIHMQKRRASEKGMPTLTRLRAYLHDTYLYLRYDFLRQPVVSEDRRLVIPLFRTGYFTRSAARARCLTDRDVLYALPAELPLDANIGYNPTQVCPALEPEEDARQAKLYAYSDLRSYVCAEVKEELEFYKAELERVNRQMADFIALAERADRFTEKYEQFL